MHGSTATGFVPLILALGSSPSGSGGPSSAVGLATLPIVNSHAESAAMRADPIVGYWCRVGSLALTHTRALISSALWPLGNSGEQCSAFLLSRPPPVCTKVVGLPGLVAAPQGVRAGSCPLVRSRLRALFTTGLLVRNECMPVISCIGPQSPASVVGLLPGAIKSSPHDHFEGIRVVS